MTDGGCERAVARAIEQKKQGQFESAASLLAEVLALEPTHAEAYYELGVVYVFTERYEEGLEELRRAVELRPASRKFLIELGKTYTLLGQYEEAIATMERVQQAGGDAA